MSMESCEKGCEGTEWAARSDTAVLYHRIRRAVSAALKRERRTLVKQEAERDEAARWLDYRHLADSIMALPRPLPRGADECVITNVHTNRREKVRLNAKLDGFENAQLYYKKAKKGERGHAVAQIKVTATKKKIEALDAVLARIESLDMGAEGAAAQLALIEESAAALGILPPRPRQARESPQEQAGAEFRRFLIDGYAVYTGKTDAQNDELTTRFARPWDIWMHVAAHAGTHAVIRREKNAGWPPRDVLVKAASIAAWFSKARHASWAEVHCTEKRFVRKPRGAAPGKVIAERCRTLRVAPRCPREIVPAGQPAEWATGEGVETP